MKTKECKKIGRIIIDTMGHGPFSADQKGHLDSCPDCKRLLKTVISFKPVEEKELVIDYKSIDNAFQKASLIKTKRNELRQFFLFLLFGVMLAGSISTLGIFGKVIPLLIFQGIMIFLVPFMLPFILNKREKE